MAASGDTDGLSSCMMISQAAGHFVCTCICEVDVYMGGFSRFASICPITYTLLIATASATADCHVNTVALVPCPLKCERYKTTCLSHAGFADSTNMLCLYDRQYCAGDQTFSSSLRFRWHGGKAMFLSTVHNESCTYLHLRKAQQSACMTVQLCKDM